MKVAFVVMLDMKKESRKKWKREREAEQIRPIINKIFCFLKVALLTKSPG